jgi:hypothetical protein
MKLHSHEIQFEKELYPQKEPMKYRFKLNIIPYAYSLEEMPFDDSVHDFAIRRKEFIRKKNNRVRKPYWRKKRRHQKRARATEKAILEERMLCK